MRAAMPFKIRMYFTLIEMLVVISILAILAALLMPGLRNAMDSARAVSCTNNLIMIGHGFSMFADDNNGMSPKTNFFTAICPYLGVPKEPPFPYACPAKTFTPRAGRVDDTNIMVNGLLGTKDPVTYLWTMKLKPVANAAKLFFVFDALLISDDPASGFNWANWIFRTSPGAFSLKLDYDRHPFGATVLFVDGHTEPLDAPDMQSTHWRP